MKNQQNKPISSNVAQTEKTPKKLMNFRPIFFSALFFASGVLLGYAIVVSQWLIAVVAFVLMLLAFAIFLILKKKNVALFLALMILTSGIGTGLFLLQNYQIHSESVEYQRGTLYGVVCDDIYTTESTQYLLLRDAVFINEQNEALVLKNRVSVSISKSRYLNQQGEAIQEGATAGDKVVIVGYISSINFFKDGVDTYSYRDNVFYQITNVESIVAENGTQTFDEKVRLYVKSVCETYMPLTGDLAYSLLTGNKNDIDSQTLTEFKTTGIIHVLAVSGLHVGFLVSICYFVIKRFNLNPWWEFVILMVPLVFYAYVCGFTPSILRALTMTAVAMLTKCFHSKIDLLNSLSLTTIILLAIRPLMIFDVGFLMSLGSVFGLITFTATANRWLARKHPNKFVKKTVGYLFASIGATLGVLPWSANTFGYFSLIGIFLNVLVVPLVSFSFILTFISLLPFVFHYVGYLADWILFAIKTCASFVAQHVGVVYLSFMGIGFVFVGVALFVFAGYLNMKKLTKTITIVLLVLLVVAFTVFYSLPTNSNGEIFVFESKKSHCILTSDTNNNYLLICNFADYSNVNDVLLTLKTKNVKSFSLAISDSLSVDRTLLEKFISQRKIDNVFIFDESTNLNSFFENETVVVNVFKNHSVQMGNLLARSVWDGSLVALRVQNENTSFGVILTDSIYQIETLCNTMSDIVTVFFTFFGENVVANACSSDIVVCYRPLKADNILSTMQHGNFTITTNCGKINVKL